MHACSGNHLAISRRGFGSVMVGAGAFAVFSPAAFASGNVEALGITCIDYRLVDDAVRFFDKLGLQNSYDQVSLAGAALAAVSPKFPSANAAFWDQLGIAINLHHVKKLVVVDHRDCGAYKVAFGKAFAAGHDAETAQHKSVMQKVRDLLAKRHPDIAPEFYLMALDGSAERVL